MTMKSWAVIVVLFLAALPSTSHADSRPAWAGWLNAVMQKGRLVERPLGRVGSGVPLRPFCLPTTCEAAGKNCGTVPDGCGGTLTCGTCSGIDTCGGGGRPNVCGQTCYGFNYIAGTEVGPDNVFSDNNCTDSPQNLTNVTAVGATFSRLTTSPTLGTLTFTEEHVSADGRRSQYMDIVQRGGGRFLSLATNVTPAFEAIHVDLASYEAAAIVALEADGRLTIRLNQNRDAYYPAADSRIVLDSPEILPFEIVWIPNDDQTSSRRLVVSTASIPGRGPSLMYVLQLNEAMTSARAIPLEDGVHPGAMVGFNAAPSRRGGRLLYVKNTGGNDRILQCNVDFSDLERNPDSGHAYCRDSEEVPSLRGMPGDMASPCWSYDNQWIFYASKAEDSTWDIYRDRYNGPFQREGLVITGDRDEKEVACGPLLLEAVSGASATVQPYREPAQVYQGPAQTYEVLQTCTNNTQCTNGRVCRDGYCRNP